MVAARLRAVSPVVAALILITIAVIGGFLVWTFMSQFSKPRTIASLSVSSASATIPPDGSECSINLLIRNDGNVPLTIDNVTFVYNGNSKTIDVGRKISAGATITLGYTLKPSDFSATSFVEGDTIKITVAYKDPQGNEYTKTVYATIQIG